MTPGIHLLHKPVGPTSFSVVQTCIKSLKPAPGHRPPRICHGGTLDPFASGLLLILVEPATRLFDYLHDIPKTYEAVVRWGIETDNGDPQGAVVSNGDASALSAGQLDAALASFVGWRDQTPHATSARRVDGERAYIKAHRGETVVMPPAKVYLHEAAWLSHDLPNSSRLRLTVRGGYYVRALGRDLGRLLGCGAHLCELRRASIGPWVDPGLDNVVEINGRGLLPWAQARVLTDQEVGDLRERGTIGMGTLQPPEWNVPEGFPPPGGIVRGFHREKFCFLLEKLEIQLKVVTALRGGL